MMSHASLYFLKIGIVSVLIPSKSAPVEAKSSTIIRVRQIGVLFANAEGQAINGEWNSTLDETTK